MVSKKDWKQPQQAFQFVTFYRTRYLGSDLWVCLSVTHALTELPLADLDNMTLADEDTNPILTDGANRTFQSNVAMQVTKPGGQLWNQTLKQCK